MKYYELTYLISPNLSEEELKTFQRKINSFVQTAGKGLEQSKNPIKKKLEYPIQDEDTAFLVTLNFYSEPEDLENLEKKLKKEPSILRYLILNKKLPEKIKIPEIKPRAEIKKIRKERKVKLEKIEEKLDEILGEI